MSHESQLVVPDSFRALYLDARRQRLLIPVADLQARAELCEDLAQQLLDQAQRLHHDLGLDQADVLLRCHAGLRDPSSGLTQGEAGWVVLRLAELAGWPWQEWSDLLTTSTTSGQPAA
ncbi:MAG: hypothetical protein RL722_41 [Pseudomonadota bacterium]|jgi:hypothetical protein